MQDTSHLVALHESLSRTRLRLQNAHNDQQREFFQRCLDSKQREIDAELRFLGIPTETEFMDISDEELLAELSAPITKQ